MPHVSVNGRLNRDYTYFFVSYLQTPAEGLAGFGGSMRSQDEWIAHLARRNAFWIHDGNPRRPHILTQADFHSGGFFNSEMIMEDPMLSDEVAQEVVAAYLQQLGRDFIVVNRTVSTDYVLTLAHDVARHLTLGKKRAGHGPCLRTLATPGNPGMIIRKSLRPEDHILIVQDCVSTGDSIADYKSAVQQAGGSALPYVLAILNRSGASEMKGFRIISLLNVHLPRWDSKECPLCGQGSEAIRPRGQANWKRLTAKY